MPTLVQFGCFSADVAAGQLYKHAVRIRLRDQSFQVLQMLLEHAGEVVTRDDLRRALWPADVFVDFENGLNTAVARLREALGDSAEHPRFIETLSRRGYRFIASLSSGPVAPAAPVASGGTTVGDAGGGAGQPGRAAPDPIAYCEYVRGRRHLEDFRNSHDTEQARIHLEQAVARDPEFVLAHEALAQLYWIQGYLGLMPPRDAFAVAILHAVRALNIDNTRAETHALLGQIQKQIDYNWPDIEREHLRALELDPTSPFAQLMYGIGWLMPQGRIRDAITTLERILQRDPLSRWVNQWLGVLLVLARDWDRAIALTRLMIELDPNSTFGHWLLGVSYRGKGLVEEGIAAHRRAVELSGGWHWVLGWLGLMLGASGRTDEARAVLDQLQAMARTTYVPPSSIAWVHLGLRDVDAAFEWLDRAIDECDQFMMPIRSYAFFDPIRPDPRFAGLLRKMKLD